MASFSGSSSFGQQAQAPLTTGPLGSATNKKGKSKTRDTFEGGEGFKQNAKSELFLTAVSCMLGEPTYYEGADERVERIQKLTAKITEKDPEWIERFVPWLRNTANMRTVTIAIACEYIAAGGPNGRAVINSAMSRAEEPMEALGYWMHFHYGQNPARFRKAPALPQALRKGIADACNRLWNEYSVLKYDGNSRKVGMKDVLNLVHAKPGSEETAALFSYIVKSGYGKETDTRALPKIAKQLELRQVPVADRRAMVTPELVREAGFTWEQVSGWVGGAWDAALWEAVIPSMGYMALLRNLRNFDQAGISNAMVKYVSDKLEDPEQVARSRQLPFRFYSAYKNTDSDNWKRPISAAMELSTQNIPVLEGNSLVLVDSSGSMYAAVSGRSQITCQEIGALFGASLWKKTVAAGNKCDLVMFATDSGPWNLSRTTSIPAAVQQAASFNRYGYGTNFWQAVERHYDDHDRVVVLSDMQVTQYDRSTAIENSIPFIHSYNLVGYPTVAVDGNKPGRFNYGGFSDACFRLMATLEQYSGDWPF